MERRELHVLLVEDDEDDSLLTRELLAEIPDVDLDFDWAPSFAEGLARVAAGSVDVCLVDHFLGARTGVEFVREARALPEAPPLILLTGATSREVDLAAMEAGASDFLQKEGVTSALLDRSIRYSIQKQKAAVAELALVRERAARGAAESANHAKDQILARLSHELRTPLAPILGVATLLEDELGLSDTGREQLQMLRRNAEQEARLIDDLLDLTQGLEERREVRKEVADLASLLEIAIGSGPGVSKGGSVAARPPRAGRPLHVLLVEDHEDTALATAALLRRLGHQVTRAADSPAALAAAVEAKHADRPFDLVVSDLWLGEGSGLDLMQELAREHRLRGIAVSGLGGREAVERCLAAGFARHLTKPVSYEALASAVEEVAGLSPAGSR